MNSTEPTRRSTERPRLSIIIPAYNEEKAIARTIETIAAGATLLSPDWEIVVVDDGSVDQTAPIVKDMCSKLPVRLVSFSRNFGKEYAITAGLDYSAGDIVICMDADGQHSIELLPDMLEKWRAGYDMVYAVRQDRAHEAYFKRWGARLFYRAMGLGAQIDIPRDAGDFRLMDRQVVEALRKLPEKNRFMKGMYAWVGFRSIGIPYIPLPRQHGITSFSRFGLIRLAWTGLTSFSVLPLRLASAVGCSLAIIAFFYGLWVAIDHLFFDRSIPGWPTIVVSMMFFSGIQLLFIGILGEYLARIYNEVKDRPSYIVADVAGRSPFSLTDENQQDA